MKYITIEGLDNEVYVFDEKDNLCPKCSYPLSKKGCLSCNIFHKNKEFTGGRLYFERILSVGKYVYKKGAEKPSKKSPDIMTWLILSYKSNKDFIPYCAELLKLKILSFLEDSRILSREILICCIPDFSDREYKKADLLLEKLSEKLEIICKPLLKKVKNIEKHHKLKNIKEKFENVKDAFSVENAYKNIIKGKIIFLIDDVVSSMASINECSKILKESGAREIYVFSLGRNILPEKEIK